VRKGFSKQTPSNIWLINSPLVIEHAVKHPNHVSPSEITQDFRHAKLSQDEKSGYTLAITARPSPEDP
jgi:hypothetical protein